VTPLTRYRKKYLQPPDHEPTEDDRERRARQLLPRGIHEGSALTNSRWSEIAAKPGLTPRAVLEKFAAV
jgi:hypothetical protein